MSLNFMRGARKQEPGEENVVTSNPDDQDYQVSKQEQEFIESTFRDNTSPKKVEVIGGVGGGIGTQIRGNSSESKPVIQNRGSSVVNDYAANIQQYRNQESNRKNKSLERLDSRSQLDAQNIVNSKVAIQNPLSSAASRSELFKNEMEVPNKFQSNQQMKSHGEFEFHQNGDGGISQGLKKGMNSSSKGLALNMIDDDYAAATSRKMDGIEQNNLNKNAGKFKGFLVSPTFAESQIIQEKQVQSQEIPKEHIQSLRNSKLGELSNAITSNKEQPAISTKQQVNHQFQNASRMAFSREGSGDQNNNYPGQLQHQSQQQQQNIQDRSPYASSQQSVTEFLKIGRLNKGGTMVTDAVTSLNQTFERIANNTQGIIITTPLTNEQYQAFTEDLSNNGTVVILGWVMLIIIGLWTFVLMVSDVIDFSNLNFVKMNSVSEVAAWYSTNSGLQQAAAILSGSIRQNYITLLDFLVYYVISKAFASLWLCEDYWESSAAKSAVTILCLIKDVLVIVLSLTASTYEMASGWTGFGVFWVSSIGKMSILISLHRIFYFRLKYFKEFGQAESTGCSGVLRRWGTQFFNWASADGSRNPDVMLVCIISLLYLPLVIHVIVGLIETTYVIIIWIAVLFFLQIMYYAIGQLCEKKEEGRSYSLIKVIMTKQKQQLVYLSERTAVLLLLLLVLIPSVATSSFSAPFSDSIQYHFSGQQLSLQFFSLPESTYVSRMTFLCNLISLF